MSQNPYHVDDSGTPDGGDMAFPEPQEQPEKGMRSPRSQAAKANLVLAALCIAGAGVVYGLTLRKGPDTAEACAASKTAEAKVDTALLRMDAMPATSRRAGGTSRELLRRFYDEVRDRQVPLDQIRKDPFHFVARRTSPKVVSRGPGSPAGQDPACQVVSLTPEEVAGRLDALRLQAIQRGSDEAIAIISNELVTAGQQIDCFIVRRIGQKDVVLTWSGREYILNMP